MALTHGDLIAQLTLEEKASLTSGLNFWNTEPIERLGIPSIMLTDGPHGVRKQVAKGDHLGIGGSVPATCFPTAATLAQSWDPALLEKVGEMLGVEARSQGVSVLLGPGFNIVRDPRGGRSFEYFSEDPLLAGSLAASMTTGIQSTGISACPKHFAVNSQELMRMTIDEVIDERSLREIYLDAFRRVVEQASPRMIMTSYNRVNGHYTNEHPQLMNEILRGEWGYRGVVVTDWGGGNDRVAGLKAGNHLEMPSTGGLSDAEVVAAVRGGSLDEAELDARVDELLDLILATSQVVADAAGADVDLDAHHEFAVEAARRSMVLLQNDGTLPLVASTRVAVVGEFAATPRYQGAGSSIVNPTRLETALDALRASGLDVVGYEPGFTAGSDRVQRGKQRRALKLAAQADVTLLFLGLDESAESEGVDRDHLRLPQNQLALVSALTQAGRKVVVVLAGGSPVELPFAPDVAAMLHSTLAGQGGGRAIADVLTGVVSPAGRLAVSYPMRLEDAPTAPRYPAPEASAEHREGIFIGYRYYETRGVPVRFAFGHGLSYTTFEYSALEVERDRVSLTVTNSGDREGDEVVQVYAGPVASEVAHARVQLAGFVRVSLQPGESQRVEVPLDRRAFEYYSVGAGRWVAFGGEFTVEVGASLGDIRLTGVVSTGESEVSSGPSETIAAYREARVQDLSDADFETLLGRTPPPTLWEPRRLKLDDTPAQLRFAKWWGRGLLAMLFGVKRLLKAIGKPHESNAVMYVVNAPFRKMGRMSGGRLTEAKLQRFLDRVNKK